MRVELLVVADSPNEAPAPAALPDAAHQAGLANI
jgi:hypothetical protein